MCVCCAQKNTGHQSELASRREEKHKTGSSSKGCSVENIAVEANGTNIGHEYRKRDKENRVSIGFSLLRKVPERCNVT